MTDIDIKKINKLTFGELRKELAECNDSVKEQIIRKMMLIKYKHHIDKKKAPPVFPFNDNDFNKLDKPKPVNIVSNHQSNTNRQQQPKINQYSRDISNNNLMDRLSNDIDINAIKNGKQPKPTFIPPYSNINNNTDCNYATFNNFR
jgi:hypothetical protein